MERRDREAKLLQIPPGEGDRRASYWGQLSTSSPIWEVVNLHIKIC